MGVGPFPTITVGAEPDWGVVIAGCGVSSGGAGIVGVPDDGVERVGDDVAILSNGADDAVAACSDELCGVAGGGVGGVGALGKGDVGARGGVGCVG